MIIFDLDGTLADCEHRRHFVDPTKDRNAMQDIYSSYADGRWWDLDYYAKYNTLKKWKPDWKSFYEACDEDKPNREVIRIFTRLSEYENIQIWSGRCETVRKKTETWLEKYSSYTEMAEVVLKMRPIGDNTPDDVLKEKWLDEYLNMPNMDISNCDSCNKIDFVFDDRKKVCNMWRRRGIFVFNCCQHSFGYPLPEILCRNEHDLQDALRDSEIHEHE